MAELLTECPAATRQFLRDRLYARIEADVQVRGHPAAVLRRELQAMLADIMEPGRRALAAE